MKQEYSLSWNLESLFNGGSSSIEFNDFVEESDKLVTGLLKELQEAGEASAGNEQLTIWTGKIQNVLARLREADSFVSCLTSQQISDKRAVAWTERIQTLSARYRQALDLYDAKLSSVPE
jgi:oligoendopeptidase F